MKNHILISFLFVILIWSCEGGEKKAFDDYMKKHHADSYVLTEYPSQNLVEKEAIGAIKQYLFEIEENPSEYYIFYINYKSIDRITFSIEHKSGYELMYYWISERGREIPIVGDISGKGKTITWDIERKEIISVGVIQ